MRPEAAPTSGTGITLAVCAILILATLTILVIAIRSGHGDDSDDDGPPPGGGGPDRPRPPQGGPSIEEPQWWPDFERQFREYAETMARRPPRTRRRSALRSRDASPSP
jgi:hypothetical protein